jgi:hypothetical protein
MVCLLVLARGGDPVGWEKAAAALAPPAEVVVDASGRGYGACLRDALACTSRPVVVTVSTDYPYPPADLPRVLAELDAEQDTLVGRIRPAVVAGCRGGRPAPGFWRAVGVTYRVLARVCCGFTAARPPGWLGMRGHWHSWLGWLLFANPLADPDSTFRAYRRELFDLFPVQCDGDFAPTEIVAKAAFCTRLVAEVPLSPTPAAVPAADWAGWARVFRRPEFTPVQPAHA